MKHKSSGLMMHRGVCPQCRARIYIVDDESAKGIKLNQPLERPWETDITRLILQNRHKAGRCYRIRDYINRRTRAKSKGARTELRERRRIARSEEVRKKFNPKPVIWV